MQHHSFVNANSNDPLDVQHVNRISNVYDSVKTNGYAAATRGGNILVDIKTEQHEDD